MAKQGKQSKMSIIFALKNFDQETNTRTVKEKKSILFERAVLSQGDKYRLFLVREHTHLLWCSLPENVRL